MQEAFKLHHGFQRVFCILGMVMMGLDMVLRLGVPDPCATGEEFWGLSADARVTTNIVRPIRSGAEVIAREPAEIRE
ncbi:hypothetical protein NZ708_16920 [Pseudomonas syringae pv. actinidiae ICMP 18708]|nr:hypothetical protein IYO_016940 [Pseudomonas syringae pv. actinidiae ICMP 18884]AOE57567.1 hypothetical protein NZ708_16920 [Pseudomonas syringae pv. actinidiae ICMP 18708]APP98523.1 hypothetical protein PsaNZ45_17470 [Pseudomonas syringae pv. actinidiae]EPM69942.1 (2Fe-2S)-binding protein [Pseudomonas syringae pv. actinidiae ICMP 18886]EPN67607.1 (2Fe-2S)-binding protein [Pseudomonas syringae pv. actinidiae ICMP 19101]EPN69383.1 (2Fe-2S)-binding protein [Pseudomonas syringae pv. actinidiae